MTKRLTVVAVISAALVFAAGCGGGAGTQSKSRAGKTKPGTSTSTTQTATGKMRKFVDPDGLFTIMYPVTWFSNGGSSMAVEMSPSRANAGLKAQRDTSVPSVEILASKNANSSAESLLRSTVSAILRSKPAATQGRFERARIAGGPGLWTDIAMSTKVGDQVRVFVAAAGEGKKRMMMFGYSPLSDWEKNLPTFKAMAESFRFSGTDT